MSYEPPAGVFDEAFDSDGGVRPLYAEVLGALGSLGLERLADGVQREAARRGLSFVLDGRAEPFALDPVPRLIEAGEWSLLEEGLMQRVRALDRFVADVYAEQEIVAAGVVPARAIESCDHFEPRLVGLPPAPVRIGVAGLDLVRGRRGSFGVLEDNVRTPSGLAYALAARECLDAQLPARLAEHRRPLDDAAGMLGRTLRAAAPAHARGGDPVTVMLSDGPENSAWYEHERLARRLELPIVRLTDLSVRGGRLEARTDGGRLRVDVLYRRTDEDRLTDAGGDLTDVGAMLLEPIEKGTLTCVNAFGTGVADDKLIHAYVEDMVRFYLGEEPLLPSVATYDPHMKGPEISERVAELVIKPRTGHGGHGVVVAPHARDDDVRAAAAAVRDEPGAFVAQETVPISTHPTVVGDHLEPRHVDLRPFVYLAGEEAQVVPGGLTRVAFDRGALVVNSSQRGGGKDTWVMA